MGAGGNQQLNTQPVDENDPRRAGWFKGDDDLMVDRLVSACAQQKKGPKEPLPGFGRNLVPYFVPDAPEEPDEDDINVTPADGTSPTRPQPPDAKKAKKKPSAKKLEFKQEIAQSQFAIPKPGLALHHSEVGGDRALKQPPAEFLAQAMSTVSEAQRQQSAAAFAAASAAIKKTAGEKKKGERKPHAVAVPVNAPAHAAPTKKASKASKGNSVHSSNPSKHQSAHSAKNQSPEKERWAGGAYANAPAPMNIPLPNIMMSQPAPPLALSQSPPSIAALQSSSLLSLLQQGATQEATAPTPAPAPTSAPVAVPKPAIKLLTPADLLAQTAARPTPSPPLQTASPAVDILALIKKAQPTPVSCHAAAAAAQPSHYELPHNQFPARGLTVGSAPNDASKALREMLNF